MASTTAVASSVSTAIDVNGLVSQLMTAEQIPITKLATKTASYQAKLSAFGTIQGAMASFQTSVATMSNASTFQTVTATASDTTTMSATALTSALPGSYSIEVSSLAQAQTLVTNGQASISTAIGSSTSTTLSFDFGTITGTATSGKYGTGTTFSSTGAGIKTVTIDSTNNTLQGMRDAINAANIGVTASIINDGSSSPYRLVVSSAHMGAANSMKISASGDATVSALLANDPTAGTAGQNLTESVAGLNANFKVNGVAISKNSNTVIDAIPGVTLNLSKITTAPVTLTVAQDTASVTKSVTDFVTAYNALTKSLTDVSSYNAATKTGAVLQGDATVRNLQAQLRSVLNTPGAGTITSLSQIGVTFQRDGTLALDSTKLATVMKSDFSGIAGLFASTGKASDSLTTFMTSTSSTKPGIYPLTVTQIATQGNETGPVPVNPFPKTITAGSLDTLIMNIDGINATITLTPKAYATAQDMASEIQSKINSVTAYSSAGIGVAATADAQGRISVTSNSYGSTSSVIATGGTALPDIFGSAISTTGVNVAGTINGVAATGSGQTLTSGSGNAQGLAVFINGGSLGSRGTITFTQGYAYALKNFTTSVMATGGVLSSSTTEINNSIKSLADRTTVLQQRLIGTEARYRAQFTALDQMLASMNTTSTFLTQQLSKL
jgi:flagellar hook-associated protein 2